MSWLARVILGLIHLLYRAILLFRSLWLVSNKNPLPLVAERSKLPKHCAVILVSDPEADVEEKEKYMLENVEQLATWCRMVGIPELTVYDREGIVSQCSSDLRERLLPCSRENEEDDRTKTEQRYPLTPPPSDDAESRSLSPNTRIPPVKLGVTTIHISKDSSRNTRRTTNNRPGAKRRRILRNEDRPGEQPLTVHVVSRNSGKRAIASAATSFLRQSRASDAVILPSIDELNNILEGEYGFPSPDLTIVHCWPRRKTLPYPVQLSGFPPWQSRLTEISWDPRLRMRDLWSRIRRRECSLSLMEEVEFRSALDEYSGAEQRLGK